jgi:hypothetical protein
MPMMMAIKARTEVMTPKMMVPVESELRSVLADIAVEFNAGYMYDLRVVLVMLKEDMVALWVWSWMRQLLICWQFEEAKCG